MQGRSHSGHGQHTGSVSGFHQGHEGDLQGRRYGWAPPSAPHCPSNHHLRTTQPGSQDYPVALYESVVTAPFLSEAPCNKATGRRVRELRLRPPSRHGQESQARQGYHIQTSWSSWPSISWLCMDCLWRECLVISTNCLTDLPADPGPTPRLRAAGSLKPTGPPLGSVRKAGAWTRRPSPRLIWKKELQCWGP